MARKASEDKPNGVVLPVEVGKGETLGQKSARLAVAGVAGNAFLTLAYGVPSGMLGQDELKDLHDELKRAVERTQGGGTEMADQLLTAQAASLNQIFVELARRASLNMASNLDATDTYLRLALKAQSQCRSTLESLSEIRSPRQVAFVKQANIAAGHQQVNNGTERGGPPNGSREEKEKTPIELLGEETNVTRLDTRATSKTSRGNPALETVGAVHRPENRRRKGSRVA